MSNTDNKSNSQKIVDQMHRRAKLARTLPIVIMVLGIGVMVALVSMLSFPLGLTPERDVLRHGTVRIMECNSTTSSFGLTYKCTAKVLEWEPEDNWVKGQVSFTEDQTVTVISTEPLSGTLDVESHRHRWKAGDHNSTAARNEIKAEVIVPSGWEKAPAIVGVLAITGALVIPVGAGLGASWALHRRR